MLSIEVGGGRLQLLADRAAFVTDLQTLLVADVHVGKDASFRGLGVPVPPGATATTLDRLSRAIEATEARRLIVLGDFLHSPRARSPDVLHALAAWRERHASLGVTLLRGNHDARAGDPPAMLGIDSVDAPLALGPYRLAHEPAPHDEGYVLAGHLHPCTVVAGRGFDRLRLPCFHFGRRVGVLPAFGEFTGGHTLPRECGDRVYAVAEGAVMAL
ncbi:MAG: ligase-associated DNA damage response endonuclease PdeM [Burkholderiaceae bacterium]